MNKKAVPSVATDMVWIPGGQFMMGSDDYYPEEAPRRAVAVDGFYISTTPVTNAQFGEFVSATGYKTVAERPANAVDYPGADAAMLRPASAVFVPPEGPVDLHNPYNWWRYVLGADWAHPLGPDSSLDGLGNHPVVHVAWEDVKTYAEWAGLALPTEVEWEYACWAGERTGPYAWGSELMPGGSLMANIWQGEFPYRNTADDGWLRTSPVRVYPANDFGLYDMIGNVWEWTQDEWSATAPSPAASCCSVGSKVRDISDLASVCASESGIARKTIKGGSHLCAPNYCRRYRPAARHPQPIDTATSHVGFRCIRRVTDS